MKADPEDDEDFPYFCDTCGAGMGDDEDDPGPHHEHEGQHYCGTCVGEAQRKCGYGVKLLKLVPIEILRAWWG